MLIRALVAAAVFLACVGAIIPPLNPFNVNDFVISVNSSSIPMGKAVSISITWSSPPTSAGTVFWPFVNGSQWGAFVTCFAAPSSDKSCSIELPLPHAGENSLQFAVFEEGRLWGGTVNSSDAPVCDEARGCVFVVGQPLPDSSSITALSNTVIVNVEWRAIRLPADAQHDHVCLDWEPWVHSLPCSCKSPLAPQCSSHCLQFTRHNAGGWMHRPGAAGIPILGMYSSFNPAVIRQHAFWMVEAGVNCILVDWSNNLWSGQSWDARSRGVQELINATALALRTHSLLRAEGHDAPRFTIMIGLQNGPPADPNALGDESQWIHDNFIVPLGPASYVALPRDPLPLLIVLACGMGEPPNSTVTSTISRGVFTIRYMSTQLQDNPDLGLKKGFWSWMDGAIDPVPTLRPDGSCEAVTVTPAYFADGGWLMPSARGQRRGSTLVAELASAAARAPSVTLICQWNEWAGQPDGLTSGYVDIYNLTFSNDLEPVSPTECGGYLHAQDAGQLPVCNQGWGFANLGLLTAALRVYRNQALAPLVRIDSPADAATDGGWAFPAPLLSSDHVNVSWRVLGNAAGFHLSIEGVPSSVVKTQRPYATLDFSQLPDGCWVIKVRALSPSDKKKVRALSPSDAASAPTRLQPSLPIVNASCPRYRGVDFGAEDYLAVQLKRS